MQVTDKQITKADANTGIPMREAINNIFEALNTQNSGATPPQNPQPFMPWVDTSSPTTHYLKCRNHANDEWFVMFEYDVATKAIKMGDFYTKTEVNTLLSDMKVTPLSGITAYHIYNGQLSLSNTVTTAGFSTTLYTGNGTTQSITTGVDMDTQWGNDASEKFGGLVWGKSRSSATHHMLYDTIRGATNNIQTNLTNAQSTNAQSLTAFGSNGFTIGSDVTLNTNLATQVAWNFQTTHRISGTTNHGKAFTCHYNPFTGFTIVKYEGSGLAGHEIPHYLGRKLGFWNIKDITSGTYNWATGYRENSQLKLNLTDAEAPLTSGVINLSDTATVLGNSIAYNTAGDVHIMYGWANSYFDDKSTLIGNYEIGVYQGTGVAGNKVTTRGKPAWIMVKRLDTTANWIILDNLRSGANRLFPNASSAEITTPSVLTFNSDGFTVNDTAAEYNASGGQYLYMVVYDNDSGSGKSKYPKATDTSTLNLNAHVPFANGIDATGSKVSVAYKNETITLSNALVQGKNYIALLNSGSYVATPYEPMYSMRNRSKAGENPDYFDVNSQKWYSTTGGSELVVNGTFTTDTSGWTANSSTLSVSNGALMITADAIGDSAYQVLNLEIGKKYTVKGNITLGTSAGARISVTSVLGTYTQPATTISNTTGSYTFTFTATATNMYLELLTQSAGVGTAYFDNISCFEAVPTIGVPITPRNYLDCVVYADQNGQPEYVEQLPKTTYFDKIKANIVESKNTLKIDISVDNSTTPPTYSGNGASSVLRTATGYTRVYFNVPFKDKKYRVTFAQQSNIITGFSTKAESYIDVYTANNGGTAGNYNFDMMITGELA